MSEDLRCVECQHAARRPGSSLAGFPGTVQLKASGLCNTCYNRGRRCGGLYGVQLTAETAPTPNDAHNVLALADYMTSRRTRLARLARRAA